MAIDGYAEELIITAITLNQQPKGEFFVYLREDRDFLVRAADLEQIGLVDLDIQPIEKNGENYYALSSVTGLDSQFDENTLTIDLMAEPELLQTTRIDLASRRRKDVFYPKDDSLFFNYGLDYLATDNDLEFTSFSLSHELGVRYHDILFLTDGQYRDTPDQSEFIRLSTSISHDKRDTYQRLIVGDVFAASGALGGRVNMGGISVNKVYRIDPYFIRYPLFDFNGQASLPSEVEVYLDGVKLRTEDFAPGEFSLENIEGTGGARTVEVVVRDVFGRERHYLSPFYFTDKLLRKGLHEYSYNLGFLRRDFGVESNRYGNLAFAAFHRFGLTDALNFGTRGEVSENLVNLGVESLSKLGPFGLLRLESSASKNTDDYGIASLASYEYRTQRLSGQLSYQHFTQDYRTLSETSLNRTLTIRSNLRVGLGYTIPRWGSFSADYSKTRNYEEADQTVTTLSWSKRLWRGSYLHTSLRQVKQNTTAQEAWVSLTLHFGNDYSATSRYRHEEETDIFSQNLRKTTPTGEGIGWEIIGAHTAGETDDEAALDGFVQYNAKHAILRGDYSENFGIDAKKKNLALRLSGALVYIDNIVGFTRPVTDSFALVTVGDAEDVQVNVNGQEIGRTNHLGKVVVPSISSYYDNRISFEDKDLPIDYLMPQVRLNVSPPRRSGSCINFPLQRYQAFTGTLLTDVDGKTLPLSNSELIIQSPSGPVKFWTGSEGEFYLDSQMDKIDILSMQGCAAAQDSLNSFLPAGTYPIKVKQENRTFETEITLPQSDEIYTELGAIKLPVLSGTAPAVDAFPSPKKDSKLAEPEQHGHASVQALEPAPVPEAETVPVEHRREQNIGSPTPVVGQEIQDPQAEQTDISKKPSFTIHFPLDSSTPLPSADLVLAQALQYLKGNPDLPVEIEGHGSREGSDEYNQRLGFRRAEAFRDFLLRAGIREERIERLVSYGEHRPLCKKWTAECRNQNRRAVLLVVMSPEN